MALDHKNYNPDLMEGASDSNTTPQAISSASNQAFAVGLNGATNPAFNVDASTALQVDGISVAGLGVGNGATITVTSSGAAAPLVINALGTGAIGIGSVSTGAVTITPATTITGALTASSSVLSTNSTGGVGYATGAGGTVTQITNRSTGVTINKICGKIQTDTTSLAAGASAEFTVTNSTVAIGDVVVVAIRSGSSNVAGTAGVTSVVVVTVVAGSFILSVNNESTTTAETGAIIINFAVIKAVTA